MVWEHMTCPSLLIGLRPTVFHDWLSQREGSAPGLQVNHVSQMVAAKLFSDLLILTLLKMEQFPESQVFIQRATGQLLDKLISGQICPFTYRHCWKR